MIPYHFLSRPIISLLFLIFLDFSKISGSPPAGPAGETPRSIWRSCRLAAPQGRIATPQGPLIIILSSFSSPAPFPPPAPPPLLLRLPAVRQPAGNIG